MDSTSDLAPLQRVMLRDSLAAPTAGHHVEQLEIVFAPTVPAANVIAAWGETVRQTAALQISFTVKNGNPEGWDFITPPIIPHPAALLTESFTNWLAADRLRPLLAHGEVPWRTVFWPETRRFVWTFHHALLDGRSIARILRGFLSCIHGHHPEYLALSRWLPPTHDAITQATQLFSSRPPSSVRLPSTDPDSTLAGHNLGATFAVRLESLAGKMHTTVAALLTWAWGQAILAAADTDAIWVEQLRSGAPQPGTAGFTMNLLPMLVRAETSLCQFHRELLDLRTIETVSPGDFPPAAFPNTSGPWASVIMVEHGTLHHTTHASDSVEILKLHERKAESIVATAYILPDLLLEVEGPHRHALLASWIASLKKLKV